MWRYVVWVILMSDSIKWLISVLDNRVRVGSCSNLSPKGRSIRDV
jgi:hypothetical protein